MPAGKKGGGKPSTAKPVQEEKQPELKLDPKKECYGKFKSCSKCRECFYSVSCMKATK